VSLFAFHSGATADWFGTIPLLTYLTAEDMWEKTTTEDANI
jgi:hypothetical protein